MSNPVSGASDFLVDARGPDPMVVLLDDGMLVDVPDEPLEIAFAAVGMPGRDGADGDSAPFELVASADMPAGTPVAVDRATHRLISADAAWKPSAFVAGLLTADVLAGFAGSVTATRLTLADWSAVAGTAQLAPGQPYFLSQGGGLTVNAPASLCVALVGRAVSPTTLLIDPQPPIQL